jgi:hypothetical protein
MTPILQGKETYYRGRPLSSRTPSSSPPSHPAASPRVHSFRAEGKADESQTPSLPLSVF